MYTFTIFFAVTDDRTFKSIMKAGLSNLMSLDLHGRARHLTDKSLDVIGERGHRDRDTIALQRANASTGMIFVGCFCELKILCLALRWQPGTTEITPILSGEKQLLDPGPSHNDAHEPFTQRAKHLTDLVILHFFYIKPSITYCCPLWPSEAIWWYRTGSTLSQVMACCWWHQAITWTNVDLSSKMFCCIHFTWEQFHKKCSSN